MKIAVDAMGGDHAPREAVAGAVEATKEFGVSVILVGREEEIKTELKTFDYPTKLITVADAREKIEMDEHPAIAVRKKRDSSIVVANRLLRQGEAEAIVSAGNTGAAMAASLLTLGRIPGINRPAIAIPMPTVKGVTVLLDAGANTDCEPSDLLQFAVMGEIYAASVLGIHAPKVGLLNIGEEDTKGNRLAVDAYQLLKESSLRFIGNVEGGDLPLGACDVAVCDGFVGNMLLKFAEGMGGAFFRLMKEALLSSIKGRLGALMVKSSLYSLSSRLDYSEYGGAPLLGIKGISIIGHGRSNAKAFKNALRFAAGAAEQRIVSKIKRAIAESNTDKEHKPT